MVDVVTEFARERALSELLYADDIVLLSETYTYIIFMSTQHDETQQHMTNTNKHMTNVNCEST